MTGGPAPQVCCRYQSHSIDSGRWARYRPRPGDVVIASSYKSGTTWLQTIVLRLVAPELERPAVMDVSPWLESPLAPIEDVVAALDAQRHRRVIKTHLPFDGLPYFPEVRYLVVCRDARDVFMSLWNHYRHLIRYPILAAPRHPRRIGPPLPRCPEDIHGCWRDWMTRGWFAWETEGYPFWGNLRHTQTWWAWRQLPNIRFVHFADLLQCLPAEIAAIARHLGVTVTGHGVATVAEAVTFERMRADARHLLPAAAAMLRGGAETFFNQGTNGRWRGVLTPDDLALYDAAAARELTPASRAWLEH